MHDLLTRKQAAAYLGISEYTIDHHRERGQFPAHRMRAGSGPTAPRLWHVDDLDMWDDQRPKRPGPNSGYDWMDAA